MRKFIVPFPSINEASNLIKMGIPKTVAQYIHKLTGEAKTDYNQRRTGVRIQEKPVSHDIERARKVWPKHRIIDYLKLVPDDSPMSAILINPDTGFYSYLSYKSEAVRGGNQYRVITIDNNGNVISKWDGTLGQLVGVKAPESLELWVLDSAKRDVTDVRKTRKESKEISNDKFLGDFIEKYESIFKKVYGAGAERKSQEFYAALTALTPEDFANRSSKFYEIQSLAQAIKQDVVDKGQLETKLNEFTSYMYRNGDYKEGKYGKAALEDIVEKHTMLGAFHNFAEFIMKGKVTNLYRDVFKELGL